MSLSICISSAHFDFSCKSRIGSRNAPMASAKRPLLSPSSFLGARGTLTFNGRLAPNLISRNNTREGQTYRMSLVAIYTYTCQRGIKRRQSPSSNDQIKSDYNNMYSCPTLGVCCHECRENVQAISRNSLSLSRWESKSILYICSSHDGLMIILNGCNSQSEAYLSHRDERKKKNARERSTISIVSVSPLHD